MPNQDSKVQRTRPGPAHDPARLPRSCTLCGQGGGGDGTSLGFGDEARHPLDLLVLLACSAAAAAAAGQDSKRKEDGASSSSSNTKGYLELEVQHRRVMRDQLPTDRPLLKPACAVVTKAWMCTTLKMEAGIEVKMISPEVPRARVP